MADLSDRARAVLYAVVTDFIAGGEPVASGRLSRDYGLSLSSATIRNVLKDLEDEGYLMQPHPSSGRVPTRRAYQLFIDALMRVGQIRPLDAGRIQGLFRSELDGPELLRESGRLLSELSGVPAVILQNRSATRVVKKIRFIPTRPGELLSVVVLDDDTVENRFIHLEGPLESKQLERVHHLLDEVSTGRSLRELRGHLLSLAEAERNELGLLGKLAEGLVGSALATVEYSQEVIIEGRTSLLHDSGDPSRMRRLMVALEDRQQLIQLLDRTLAQEKVQVFLGADSDDSGASPLSVVAAPFTRSDAPAGALGVLGPTRMNYPEIVPLVGAMAGAMSEALRGSEPKIREEEDCGREKPSRS
jgi:heat-inducible transcriptional repressor